MYKRIILRFFLVLYLMHSTSNADDQLYYKIGFYDYKHETGGLLFNIKKVSDNTYNVLNFGELTQIYEFNAIFDKENKFSKGEEIKKREEYAIYLSSGLQKVINFNDHLSLVPSFSVGLYESFDEGKKMGFPIEFKSEVELYFNFSPDSYLGLTWHHISNANIGHKNPGSDSILFNITSNF